MGRAEYVGWVLAWGLSACIATAQPLPPVPVPPENPITEPKRVLGKLLFWEEQLSSDNTISCGTCHIPTAGSGDPRSGHHPGADGVFDTADDVFGSPGIRRQDASGSLISDPIFGNDVQVTARTAQGFVGNQWSPLMFWDGRAGSEFVDPETGAVVIASGGGLESQAVAPLLSEVEMAHEGRTWSEVIAKVTASAPMALASDVPPDMAAAIAGGEDYPDLFAAAFGDPAITAARIGMAIATYERTLVPDQTPWDLGEMTFSQERGFTEFQIRECSTCHMPPFFTDHSFRSIGLRDPDDDGGRYEVTGDTADRGEFKVPSLRNVALRDRLMHTGHITDVADAIAFYRGVGHSHFFDNQDPLVFGGMNMSSANALSIALFVNQALTDPRVAAGTFPFDRPALRSENPVTVPSVTPDVMLLSGAPNPFQAATTIRYESRVDGPVELEVFDVQGVLVRRIVAVPNAGPSSFTWDGRDQQRRDVRPGLYFARVSTPTGAATVRIVRSR